MLNKPLVPAVADIRPPQPQKGLPAWKLMPPAQLNTANFGPATSIVSRIESGNRNVRQFIPGLGHVGPASGYVQIEDATWRDFAPQAGVNVTRYPTAMRAPAQVQAAVAARIPLRRWARPARDAVLAAYPWANDNMTLGQIDTIAAKTPRQRYILTADNRQPKDWGKTPAITDQTSGPGYLPTRYDVPAIMDRGRRMQPMFSQNVGVPHMLMLNSWQNYQQAQQGGQLLDMFHQATSWKQNLSESKDRMEEEAIDMSSAWGAYGGDNDPTRLTEAMMQIANKYNDAVLGDIVDNPDAIQRLMQERDKYFQDVSKTDLAQQKAARDQELANARIAEIQAQTGLAKARTSALGASSANVEQQWGTPDAAGGAKQGVTPPAATPPPQTQTPPQKAPPTDARTQAGGPPTKPPTTPIEEPPQEGEQAEEREDGDQEEREGDREEGDEGQTGEEGQADTGPQASAAPAPGAAGGARPVSTAGTPPGPTTATAVASPADRQITTTAGPAQAPGTAPGPSGGPVIPPIAEPQGITPLERQLGRSLIRGSTIPTGLPKSVSSGGEAYNEWLQSRLDDITNNPENYGITGTNVNDRTRAVLDAVRQVDPTIANLLPGILNGQIKPPQLGFGGGGRNFVNTMTSMALLADPNYDATRYLGREANRRDYTTHGKAGQTLMSANRFAEAARQLIDAVRNQDPATFKNITAQRWQQWVAGNFTGDPTFSNIFSAWRFLTMESVRIARQGTGNEGDIQAQINATPPASSPDMILGALKIDTANADATINALRQYWKSNMAGEAPGYQAEAEETLKAITQNLDPNTATFIGRGSEQLPSALRPYMHKVGTMVGGRVVGKVYMDGEGNHARWLGVNPSNVHDPDNWQISGP